MWNPKEETTKHTMAGDWKDWNLKIPAIQAQETEMKTMKPEEWIAHDPKKMTETALAAETKKGVNHEKMHETA